MEEKVDSYWDDADGLWETVTQDHGYCLFSIIKISYDVTCLNKLRYPGVKYFFSGKKCLKSGWTHGNFSSEEKDFLKNVHDWREISLDSLKTDGSIASIRTSFNTWNFKQKFDKENLKEHWKEQRVAFPEWKYVGEPGKKLARPVVFVHGLDSDFEVWGVESTSNLKGSEKKNSVEFQQGLVKKYERGSAPDILARAQNIDNTEANINHNGIYFFQAPGDIRNGEWDEALPFWDNGNETNSQSRKLYKFLGEVLDDFCSGTPIDWKQPPELTVDIVAHSQGGLVVREMLRGLRADKGTNGSASSVRDAVKILHEKYPNYAVDGEMQASVTLNKELRDNKYPFNTLKGKDVNTLIFPCLSSANITCKMLLEMGVGESIGPVQMGLKKPVHFTDADASVHDIFNLTVAAVIDAIVQEKKDAAK